jgi:hypothetical protein
MQKLGDGYGVFKSVLIVLDFLLWFFKELTALFKYVVLTISRRIFHIVVDYIQLGGIQTVNYILGGWKKESTVQGK